MIKYFGFFSVGRRISVFSFNHFNFNVLDLDKSLTFYKEALGLVPVREKSGENPDGPFKLVYLGD